MAALSNKPDNLSPTSSRVFDTLARHTAFPWPVMQAQCRRLGRAPETLVPADVPVVAEALADSVARFGKPGVKALLLAELRAL